MINNPLKMLVADDHRLFIEGMRLLLKDKLHIDIAGVAYNGRQAIDKCNREHFDMVLMDINMPVIGGIEATTEIKRLHPHIKVIMVSMIADYAMVTKALKAGADAYLLKSEETEELEHALSAVLKNEVYLTQSLAEILKKDVAGKITSRENLLKFSENLITHREQEVLKLIVEGYTNQRIADTLTISVRTVDTHRTNMLVKLKLPNTAALVKFAIENKLI